MRQPDQIIKVNQKKLPVFKSPFTQTDYDSIISMRHTYDEFGVLDGSNGAFKIYDFEKAHVPAINYLWNIDFSLFKSVKLLGFGVCAYYAYKLSQFRPSLPSFGSSANETGELRDLFSEWFPMTNPNTIYNGTPEVIHEEEE